MPGEATMVVVDNAPEEERAIAGWEFKGHDFLFRELEAMIKTKSTGGSIFYIIILALALLAVFDTQVLSIFRRQREIGTYIAMGMTRKQVVGIFTVEGGIHAIWPSFWDRVWLSPSCSGPRKPGSRCRKERMISEWQLQNTLSLLQYGPGRGYHHHGDLCHYGGLLYAFKENQQDESQRRHSRQNSITLKKESCYDFI